MPSYDEVNSTAVSPTPLDVVAREFANADTLATRVLALVDRLIGQAPPTETSGKGFPPRSDGKLYEVEGCARAAGASLDRAHQALSRLEGHL